MPAKSLDVPERIFKRERHDRYRSVRRHSVYILVRKSRIEFRDKLLWMTIKGVKDVRNVTEFVERKSNVAATSVKQPAKKQERNHTDREDQRQ